jgi:hypothetical protein
LIVLYHHLPIRDDSLEDIHCWFQFQNKLTNKYNLVWDLINLSEPFALNFNRPLELTTSYVTGRETRFSLNRTWSEWHASTTWSKPASRTASVPTCLIDSRTLADSLLIPTTCAHRFVGGCQYTVCSRTSSWTNGAWCLLLRLCSRFWSSETAALIQTSPRMVREHCVSLTVSPTVPLCVRVGSPPS